MLHVGRSSTSLITGRTPLTIKPSQLTTLLINSMIFHSLTRCSRDSCTGCSAAIPFQIARMITENLLGRAPSPKPMLLCADQICRCIGYCMQPQNRISAAQVVLFGISQATQCYIDCAEREKFIWCQEIYQLVSISGFTVVQRLNQEQCDSWNAIQGEPVTKAPISLDIPLQSL